jgi:hypothetical protein
VTMTVREGSGTVTVEEEWDSAVPRREGEGRADAGDSVDLVAGTAWRRMGWRRHQGRGHRKFWLRDDVRVKILQLWFMDPETRGFLGGP